MGFALAALSSDFYLLSRSLQKVLQILLIDATQDIGINSIEVVLNGAILGSVKTLNGLGKGSGLAIKFIGEMGQKEAAIVTFVEIPPNAL